MRKLILVVIGVLWCGYVFGAPTPSPTPVPEIIPAFPEEEIPVSLSTAFTAQTADAPLINLRTGEYFSVPSDYHLYITDISWSMQSAVIASLEWDGTYEDVLFDRVYFPSIGQGKVINFITPITSLDAGTSPALTTDREATGWIYIGGYLK